MEDVYYVVLVSVAVFAYVLGMLVGWYIGRTEEN